MPRRARIMLPGVPVHVIQRGNNRGACFFADEDYTLYLDALKDLAEKFSCAIHAYVLMTNHVHVLVTAQEPDGVSLVMKNLGQRYVQYVNRTHRRSGTLWEGRFRSCLTQSESYVLACYRYIELNPVRAGMVKHPREYRWSSYRVNAEGKSSELVSPHRQYLRLGRDDSERYAAYRSLFSTQLDEQTVRSIRDATNGGYVLGNSRFQSQVAEKLGRRVVRGKAGRPVRPAAQ